MKTTPSNILRGALASLVIIAVTIGSAYAAKGGKSEKPSKPGDDGGNSNIRLARISFAPNDGVRSDGVQTCLDPNGLSWDYWDWRDLALSDPDGDPETADGCLAGCTADVSGGGRLHFFTVNLQESNPTPRWLVLDFTRLPDGKPSGANPDIDIWYQGRTSDPPYEPKEGIDNVKAVIGLEKMFSPNATKQELELSVRECYHPSDPESCWALPMGFTLVWEEPLNIIQLSTKPNVRLLTTDRTSAAAKLLWDDDLQSNTPPILLGRYLMPIHWKMQLVVAP